MVEVGSFDPKERNSCSIQLLKQLLTTVESPTANPITLRVSTLGTLKGLSEDVA